MKPHNKRREVVTFTTYYNHKDGSKENRGYEGKGTWKETKIVDRRPQEKPPDTDMTMSDETTVVSLVRYRPLM